MKYYIVTITKVAAVEIEANSVDEAVNMVAEGEANCTLEPSFDIDYSAYEDLQ